MGLRDLFSGKWRKARVSPFEGRDVMSHLGFPRGRKQWEEEAAELHKLVGGRIDLREAKSVIARTKVLLTMGPDRSESYVTARLRSSTQGRLSEDDARMIYRFLTGQSGPPSGPLYTGGDGSSEEEAVVINTAKSSAGVAAEYAWLDAHYGPRGTGWGLQVQSVCPGRKRSFDCLRIRLSDGSERTIYFDISSFFGKDF